jgi:hypothetical protein
MGPGDGAVGIAEGRVMPRVNRLCVAVGPFFSFVVSCSVPSGLACRLFAKGSVEVDMVGNIVFGVSVWAGCFRAGLRLGGGIAEASSAMGALILVLSMGMMNRAVRREAS